MGQPRGNLSLFYLFIYYLLFISKIKSVSQTQFLLSMHVPHKTSQSASEYPQAKVKFPGKMHTDPISNPTPYPRQRTHPSSTNSSKLSHIFSSSIAASVQKNSQTHLHEQTVQPQPPSYFSMPIFQLGQHPWRLYLSQLFSPTSFHTHPHAMLCVLLLCDPLRTLHGTPPGDRGAIKWRTRRVFSTSACQLSPTLHPWLPRWTKTARSAVSTVRSTQRERSTQRAGSMTTQQQQQKRHHSTMQRGRHRLPPRTLQTIPTILLLNLHYHFLLLLPPPLPGTEQAHVPSVRPHPHPQTLCSAPANTHNPPWW